MKISILHILSIMILGIHVSICHIQAYDKAKKVREYCEKNNIILLFLSPYSPEYNSIQRVWSFLKSKVKNVYFSTAKKFTKFVTNLLKNINQTEKDTLLNLCISLI